MEKLHSGARWIFRLSSYSIIFFLVIFLFLGGFSFLSLLKDSSSFTTSIIVGSIGGFILLVLIFGEIYARLAYNNWGYEFTERELKIEKGIIFKNYKSIPYQRIQNVDIHRGILARMFGFSTLDIQTAGYSGGYSRYGRGRSTAEGHIPAVSIERAEQIRNWVMEQIVGKKSGL